MSENRNKSVIKVFLKVFRDLVVNSDAFNRRCFICFYFYFLLLPSVLDLFSTERWKDKEVHEVAVIIRHMCSELRLEAKSTTGLLQCILVK